MNVTRKTPSFFPAQSSASPAQSFSTDAFFTRTRLCLLSGLLIFLLLLSGCATTRSSSSGATQKGRATPGQKFGAVTPDAATPKGAEASSHTAKASKMEMTHSAGQAVFVIGGNNSSNSDGTRITIPAPRGFKPVQEQDGINQVLPSYFLPPQNVYLVFEQPLKGRDTYSGKRTGQSYTEQARGRSFIIVSALPEFMTETVDAATFKAMQQDISRSISDWSPARLEDFFHLAEVYYSNRSTFAHNLGVFDSGAESISIARIVKEPGTDRARQLGQNRWVQEPAEAMLATGIWNPAHIPPILAEAEKESIAARGGKAPAETKQTPHKTISGDSYFQTASYTLSIRNIVLVNGKCFNIYYNTPLKRVADIVPILDWNRQYMAEVRHFVAN